MFGIALVDKPQGLSSHDAIYRARRALGIRKIGHAGTLDPNATGLLVMAIGHATRFLPYLRLEPKVYEGTAKLGTSTTTQDSEGEPVWVGLVGDITFVDIESAACQFVGEIQQIPPMYSAIQIDGQRLYKIARKGGEVERPTRTISVKSFEITGYEDETFSFRIVCSGGTYVRTLAHDLGAVLGVGAHLTELRRTGAGDFSVQDAVPPVDLSEASLMPLEAALPHIPAVRLPQPATEAARHGNDFHYAADVSGDRLLLLDDSGVFAIAARLDGSTWRPERVIPA
ncbi:MAG: tRNA pseudouridine(55) synthase TruB [Fimbriimonadales bacterium]